MKKTLFAAAVLAAFTFTACSENNTENTETSTVQQEEMDQEQIKSNIVVETPEFTSVAEPMRTQIAELVDEYIKLKDALVASNADAAKAAANDVLTVARAMPVATLTTDEKAYAEEKTADVISSAEKIAAASDLAMQREHLEMLSESVFGMAKAFDANENKLYYQHCPMAMNNKGAYWLSSNEEIRNPYFGNQMLECGSTEEVLTK